jgi:hypothetical protein
MKMRMFFVVLIVPFYIHSGDLDHVQSELCFQKSMVRAQCNFDQDTVSKLRLAEIELQATNDKGYIYSYGYGKMIEADVCRMHIRKVNHLIKKARQVCLIGELQGQIQSNETFYRWVGLKTENGNYYR